MKKTEVIIFCIVFVIIFSMLSCGARKANKEHSKEETKTELTDNSTIEKKSETNVKTITTVKTDDKNETVTEETTISPEDNTKEAFIIEKDGTKVVLNNTKKTVKKTTQKNNTQSELVNKIDELKKDDYKERKAVKQLNTAKKENSVKNVERKQFTPWQLLLFIPIFLTIWFVYRKYKQLPLVPKF